MRLKNLALYIGLASCLTAMTACTPTINTRGNLVPDSKMSKVVPNVTSQYDVAQLWGPPTFVAPFEDERTWYYAGHTTERLGIYKNEIIERKLVRVDFDENGTVIDVRSLNPDNAQDVDFVNRETPTAGKEFTLLQQLVGNVGRFNGMGAAKTQPGNQ